MDGAIGWTAYFYAVVLIIAVLVDQCLERRRSKGVTAASWAGLVLVTVPLNILILVLMDDLNQVLWTWVLIPILGTIGAVRFYDCDRRYATVAAAYCSTMTMIVCGLVCMAITQVLIKDDLGLMRHTFQIILIPFAVVTVWYTRRSVAPCMKEYMEANAGRSPPFYSLFIIIEVCTFFCFILWFYEFGMQVRLMNAIAIVTQILLLLVLRLALMTVTNITTSVRNDMELDMASRIQRSVLPDENGLAWMSAFDVSAVMEPAKVVGGDFYDNFAIDSRNVAFVIADVSDKGVASALFMMRAWSTIRDKIMIGGDLGSAVSGVSDALMENNPTSMFVTAFIGKLNLDTGVLEYVNAGHSSPVIRNKGGSRALECTRAPFLGMRRTSYIADSVTLEEGDMVTMFTDGVTEAQSGTEFYGYERALEVLSGCSEPSDAVSRLKADVRSFAVDNDNPDDLTILSFKFLKTTYRRFDTLDGDPVDGILEMVSECIEGLPGKLVNRVELAIEEAAVNIVEHGFADRDGDIEVTVRTNSDGIVFVLSDNAPRFNIMKAKVRDRDVSVDDRLGGGEGIRIIRMMSDKISYRYVGGRNILVMEFHDRDDQRYQSS